MRAPGEVMAESRPSPVLQELPAMSGRSSPLRVSGRSSPLRSSSPVPERKDLVNAATGAIEGINRAQLTLQELQDLAERQRKQILYNSKELMDKQQQLMKMHQDFRTRMKVQGEPSPRQPRSPRFDKEPSSPRTPKSPKSPLVKRDQDQYARMLRETYQSMGKMQKRTNVNNDIEIKKFSNIELAHELEKVREIFSSKQNELAEAVKKVDVLTHQLEQRKNGENGSVPTPERINRRKKIQAAKDELDRLRNELIVRNEMNSQQSHQLELQRDIIHEKQQELRRLNSRMNELGNALKNKQGGHGKLDMSRKAPNQALFNNTYLQDTLSRKRSGSGRKQITSDINGNHVTLPEPITNGMTNETIDDANKSVFQETPLSGNQIWRKEPPSQSLNIKNNVPNKVSPSHSPSSSVSSLSSMSSTSMTPEELVRIFTFNKEAPPPPPPPRMTPVSTNITEPNEEFLANLRSQKQRINELQKELHSSSSNEEIQSPPSVTKVTEMTTYSDSTLSEGSDNISKYKTYGDASSSSIVETLSNKKSPIKPKIPPPPPPKPAVAQILVKPVSEEGLDSVDRVALPITPEISVTKLISEANKRDESLVDEQIENQEEPSDKGSWPSPPSLNENVPTEPDDFELSFADIDEISNDLQTDLWSNSGSTVSHSFDSEFEDLDLAPVPVVISVSPDKMPPPILMKPDKQRKEKRNVVLDPFILLLDAALEGEMDFVKETLKEVPDPSKPNAEGITALHNAVCGNHKDVVKYLVEVACDINSADNNGWTPLHCAAFYNDTELCSFLVEHGASVFATTYTDYQTPAHKCSQLDDNYDVCFGYLHECKENVGRINGGLVHALYDYQVENEDELGFNCGDELVILRRGDTQEKEWWWGKDSKGNTGYIPYNLISNYPRIAAVV